MRASFIGTTMSADLDSAAFIGRSSGQKQLQQTLGMDFVIIGIRVQEGLRKQGLSGLEPRGRGVFAWSSEVKGCRLWDMRSRHQAFDLGLSPSDSTQNLNTKSSTLTST